MKKINSGSTIEIKGFSPWSVAAGYLLDNGNMNTLYQKVSGEFDFKVYNNYDSLWIMAYLPRGGRIAFRAAFCPGENMKVKSISESENGIDIEIWSVIGMFSVSIVFYQENTTILRYTTTLKPSRPLLFPFWPRDMNMLGKPDKPESCEGNIHVSQFGTRTGMMYLSMTKPRSGSVLYFQNLTALSDYCDQTGTNCSDVVGGKWPELGLALPLVTEKPLQAGKKVIINDAFVAFDSLVPDTEAGLTSQFLDMLANVYMQIPKPETTYADWPTILEKGLHDLIENPTCWTQVKEYSYFNAYISDHETPPESMVQLAVLLPLLDYVEWNSMELKVMKLIKKNLSTFYDPELKCIKRWLPAAEDLLKGEEEQKFPDVMDSWYLHHPLLNLSRMALRDDKEAEKLFLDSLRFAMKVARHFNYRWPVFYNMKTLEVVKAETQPGMGGELDVAGSYAHIMLQAWELTGKKVYLDEAKKAARSLEGLGFSLFYQANNTVFAAGALLRLWKITHNKVYLELSNLCIANMFKNVHIWECNYGFGKHFSDFFALFPLNDAPYTAVYEENEVFCALHDYLKHATDEDILPSITLLTTEYIRYLVDRAMFYYPPMLRPEMLEEKCKVGKIIPHLWIAVEDLQDGWIKSGSIGQEVYGAGNAFGILPRHYTQVADENFWIYNDYPITDYVYKKGQSISYTIIGHERMSCRMRLIPKEGKISKKIVVKSGNEVLMANQTKEGHWEYTVRGKQKLMIYLNE